MSVKISTKDAPRYTFEVDGTEYAIPAMGSLPVPFLRKYATAPGSDDLGIDLMLDLLATQTVRTSDGSKADGLADILGMEAVIAIMADYVSGSADDLGESSASSD